MRLSQQRRTRYFCNESVPGLVKLWFFTNLLKHDTTAFELHHCRTASCNLFSWGQKALTRPKQAIRYKRRDLLSKGVLLLHDNARPLTATATIEAIRWVQIWTSHTHTYIVFTVNLTTNSGALDIQCRVFGWLVNTESERFWKYVVVTYMRTFSGLETHSTTRNNYNQVSGFPSWDLRPRPAEYEVGLLTTRLGCSALSLW
jgi:hypothetical protein